MNYMVVECRSAYAVVLSDDGQFRKVANLHYQVGQTVTDVVELDLPAPSEHSETKRTPRWITSLAAMAACLVLVMTGLFLGSQAPCASVHLTINPEVRVDVNRNDVVVSAQGVNEDGAALLEGYDYRKKDLDTVMDELVDRAIDMGYLHEGGTITLSLEGDENWVASHERHLNHHLTAYLNDRITVTIDITPRVSVPSESTAPAGTIHIPVEGETDYGDTDYGTSGETTRPDTDGEGQEDDPDDGRSDYDPAEDTEEDGLTDYGAADEDHDDADEDDPGDTDDDPEDDDDDEDDPEE